ncbi:TPA: hypothetical protein I9232_000081 [Klebsiella oxytoca]|nr:hypothetical protein [Klebsiella oxytoca]HBQ5643237.1 hypothetical protein [Klebsiella variicola]
MKNIFLSLCITLATFMPLTSHAEFTVSMYKNLKNAAINSDAENAKKAKDLISSYLMGVASGASEISQFESIKNGTPFPYCLPKGIKLTPSLAENIVDSVLSDKDANLSNVDSMSLSRIYVIGVLRYYKCN